MTMTGPRVTEAVILDPDEVEIARVAVRMYLTKQRQAWRQNVRRGRPEYNDRVEENFENALDLYERLGGNVDNVADVEE